MILGVLQIELFIPESGSLKSKRKILKSIKDRIRHKFNVSISETEYQDKWQRSILGIATVGTNKRFINEVLDKILHSLDYVSGIEVVDSQMEID